MPDRTLEGLARLIDKRKAGDKAGAESMVDLGEASGVSGAAGEVPTCTIDGDDTAEVFEPYGLAGQAPGGDALVLAPGGDVDSPTVLLSSVEGRPATEPGDKALWSSAGHVVYLDNDDSLTITSKDGATVELTNTGGIVITAASLADITLIVDNGQSVKIGDLLAESLTKWQALASAMSAMFGAGIGFVGVIGDPAGENAGAAFAAAKAAWDIAIGANSPETQKAKGS